MDTIEISLILNNIDISKLQILREDISSLISPFGYRFIDILEFSRKGNLVLKISYPRYFSGTNVYLIRSRAECFEVQKYFCQEILEDNKWKEFIAGIKLSRVDIPFTFYVDTVFSHYRNIFYIFAHVYDLKKKKAHSRAFIDLITDEIQTLIYSSNGSSRKDCNNKLEIYNQYKNLEGKLKKDIFIKVIQKYPDLEKRMRLEVSKRINLRNNFSIQDFKNFDILRKYYSEYKKYILDNILDFTIIEQLYNQWAKELSDRLDKEKTVKNFNYETFILKNIKNLYDYEIIKRALKISIDNINTRENAITKVRKILKEYEKENKVIILDVYFILHKIKDYIENQDSIK